MKEFSLRYLALGLSLLCAATAFATDDDEAPDAGRWRESDIQFPTAPVPDNLLPIYVSAATTNRYLVDRATLTVGEDGVVRYVLVVLAVEGGRSVTFEGMRCETRERRLYASGRQDGSWSKVRRDEWLRIQDATANRHYAALFLDYFCPGGVIVRNADEARRALAGGGHPDAKLW